MFKHLTLSRPLAIVDLETTGTQVQKDRIVEISLLKIRPDGTREQRTYRVNPEIPIPPEATRVHGINDADVAGQPRFNQLADELMAFLHECDLCGFNLKRFDLRLLAAELGRVGRELRLQGRHIIDAQEIFHAYERRDLSAALEFYCGKEHASRHSAEADVLATAEILDAMLDRYADLPRRVEELGRHFTDPNSVDASGKFVRVDGKICFAFGQHRGRTLDDVARLDAAYLDWLLGADFHGDTKAVVKEALARVQPANPAPTGKQRTRDDAWGSGSLPQTPARTA